MIKVKKLINSFKFAWRGLKSLIKKEQNFRLHLLVALVVLFFSIYFQIKVWQWCLIVLMIAGVFILEMLNTVFERLVDLYKPRLHDYVKDVKDLMSAIVLVASIASVIIGLLIFIPYIFN